MLGLLIRLFVTFTVNHVALFRLQTPASFSAGSNLILVCHTHKFTLETLHQARLNALLLKHLGCISKQAPTGAQCGGTKPASNRHPHEPDQALIVSKKNLFFVPAIIQCNLHPGNQGHTISLVGSLPTAQQAAYCHPAPRKR